MKKQKRFSTQELDAAIISNVQDLERLAAFYEQRGNVANATEIRQAIEKIRQEIASRNLSALQEKEHQAQREQLPGA